MRWLTRSALLATTTAALCVTQIQAACTSGTSASLATNPDSDALTLFVLSPTFSGDFKTEYAAQGIPAPFPASVATGLAGADNLCTGYAAFTPFATSSYNRNAGGGTVQFTALLSTSTVDAIDRFDGITASKNIVNSKGQCLASSLSDLFTASNNAGYNYDSAFYFEDGTDIGGNTFLWTGTGQFFTAGGVSDPDKRTAEKVGGRFHPPKDTTGGTVTYSAGTNFCNDWLSQDSLQSASTGIIKTGGGVQQGWFASSASQSCSNGYRIICVSAQPFQAPTTTPGGTGDPQFTGLQGQQFQVHGMPEEFFNLITTPAFQLNSRFTYLASGQCNYNNTECWTHPGTYVDQLGFMFPGLNIKTVAGSHRKGLRVWINDEEMKKSAGKVVMTTTTGSSNSTVPAGEVSVSHPHHDVLIVSSPLFTVEVTNSDWFFNFNLMFHAPEILEAGRMLHYVGDARPGSNVPNKFYPGYAMHGLVGQTWKNARYPAKRMYQGEVDDYMLLDHTLFSTQFLFNLYAY